MNSILNLHAIETKINELLGQSSLPRQRSRIYTVVSYYPSKLAAEYQSYFDFLTGKRPLRLICVERGTSQQNALEVAASCKLRYGTEEVCLEKIILRTQEAEGLMIDLWLPLLDHDLPAILVWAECWAKLANSSFKDEAIFDKIIINSEQSSSTLKVALQELRILGQAFSSLTALGDILWTRLSPLRLSIARLFEQSGNLSLLSRITTFKMRGLSVNHFLLIALWLAERLNYRLKEISNNGLSFIKPDNQLCLMTSEATLDNRAEITFKIDTGQTLSLVAKDNHRVDYLFNERLLLTQPLISLSPAECLLTELDSISSDPIYELLLRKALRL